MERFAGLETKYCSNGSSILSLSTVPVPYLCGVTRDNWLYVQQFVSNETVVVDLDRNTVMFGQKTPELPALPAKKWNKLRHSLEDIVGHLFWRARGLEGEYQTFRHDRMTNSEFKKIARQKGEIQWNEKLVQRDQAFNLQFTPDSHNLDCSFSEDEQHQWDRVQESFLRFFVAILKDYRRFLNTPGDIASSNIAPDANDWLQWTQQRSFDRDNFIRSQKAENLPFLKHFTTTQQFDDFITKRLYSPKMPDIIFFDQSIEAKLNRSRLKLQKVHTPFLQSAKAHKVLQKFKAVAPSVMETDDVGPFVYATWPETLNPKLFGTPRPIPSMITAEFDRQAALISRLRATYAPEPLEANQLINFYGVDYDVSPEGMAFTLFFFAYSAVIGREWQVFQRKQREFDALAFFNGALSDDIEGDTTVNRNHRGVEIEAEVSDIDAVEPGPYLGLCDACPEVPSTIDKVLEYLTSSPCSRQTDSLSAQAKTAHEVISEFTITKSAYINGRTSSLFGDEQGLAEYEEAHDVAVAQLDLAFDALKTMEIRGLLSDSDIFKSLMSACGRCGNTARALELIQMMQRDGLGADQEVLSCFMTAFAHHEETPSDRENAFSRDRSSDAYSTFLKKNLKIASSSVSPGMLRSQSEDTDQYSDCASMSSGSEVAASPESAKEPPGFLDWFARREKKTTAQMKASRMYRRKRKQRASSKPLPDRLLKQLVLGESLLDFLYPDLIIDTECDSCPQCSSSMKKCDIISGWQPRAFQDFTTCCPTCRHRFVPRFTVSCSAPSFVGSQGFGTPLYCEFLSPWVLRKEIGHAIDDDDGAGLILDPDWRRGTEVSATLWWNLIVLFRHYGLPFTFLLQGSFSNRLISPVPQDD
jgi:pentatricopeptide repeat protein